MTNHSETTGGFDNGDIGGSARMAGYDGSPGHGGPADAHQVTLRTPAELADALPYLLGYRPEDSIVLVALHDSDGRGRFGGRARLGIPANEDDWPAVARQLAHGLVTGSRRRGARPEQMVAYLCQEPARGETGRQVKERLESLAHQLRVECGLLDAPVVEALCISDGRFWSYCCTGEACCPPDGLPMGLPGTSVMAAAAAYAGIQVRGTLRELRARLLPWETGAALEQEVSLDTASVALVPRMLDDAEGAKVAEETLELAERIITRYGEAPPVSGTREADVRDDELLGHDEAAQLILGLQDRTTRDRAAQWMEGDEAGPALRLWRALARRCVGPYGEHAAAPLTLAGWVAWSAGDDIEAREALAMALGADPGYLFARLLHQAINEGLDPESVRRCLRAERTARTHGTDAGDSGGAGEGAALGAGRESTDGTGGAGSGEPGSGTERNADGVIAAVEGSAAAEPRALPASEPSPASPPAVTRRRHRTRAGEATDGSSRRTAGGAGTTGGPGSAPRTRAENRRPPVARPGGTRPRTMGKDAGRRRGGRTEGARAVRADGTAARSTPTTRADGTLPVGGGGGEG
jgi:hypothetical protein